MALSQFPFWAAPWTLLAFWLWGTIDQIYFQYCLKKYKPTPIPKHPKHQTRDVSIVVCTLDTILISRLRKWLENDPLEIIIVTTTEHFHQIQEAVNGAGFCLEHESKIVVVASPIKGKRPQFCRGIQSARGMFILSIDDHIGLHPEFLKHMLPCFEDDAVGACGPPLLTSIQEDRRHEHIISPWEVAATRVAHSRNPRLKSMHVAARWCSVLAGCCSLFRSKIIKDPKFLHGFTNDHWCGKKQDVGEDTFITRWLQSHDWIIAIQASPETEVTRTVKNDRHFFTQMFRWERSTIRTHIQTVVEVPQILSNPYAAWKHLERLFRPVTTTFHILVWILTTYTSPIVALLFIAYYVSKLYVEHTVFLKDYPYMHRYWWVAVGVDFFFIVQDYWCWLTLHDTTWESRKKLVEE